MSYNTVSKDDVKKLLEERQKSEKIMDRVSSLMQLNRSVYFVLGDNFKYSISKWQNANDKIYPCLITRPAVKPLKRHKSQQQNMSVSYDIIQYAMVGQCPMVWGRICFRQKYGTPARSCIPI